MSLNLSGLHTLIVRTHNRHKGPVRRSGWHHGHIAEQVTGCRIISTGFMVFLTDWEHVGEELQRTLSNPPPQRRCELLPRILQEWHSTNVRQYLSWDSAVISRERINKLEQVALCARQLSNALKQIDDEDRRHIAGQMAIDPGKISPTDFSDRQTRLGQEVDYLDKIGAIRPNRFFEGLISRGQPSKLAPYFILRDAAAIFEWLTDTMATRQVDRIRGTETGPFFRFASILWRVVYAKGGAGLPAAMKNWAAARSKYNEEYPLMAFIAMRHPTWGVLGPNDPILSM